MGYMVINALLSILIGFMLGAIYGMRSGRNAGKLEGWIKANQEILDRAKKRQLDLEKPFVYHSRVLVIEDNEDVREILSSVLKTYGYHVHEASTGKEAKKILERNEIHSVILDIMLPDTNGYEIAKYIHEKDSKIRLIALSGYEAEPDKVDLFDTYLKKPYQIADVVKSLAALE